MRNASISELEMSKLPIRSTLASASPLSATLLLEDLDVSSQGFDASFSIATNLSKPPLAGGIRMPDDAVCHDRQATHREFESPPHRLQQLSFGPRMETLRPQTRVQVPNGADFSLQDEDNDASPDLATLLLNRYYRCTRPCSCF